MIEPTVTATSIPGPAVTVSASQRAGRVLIQVLGLFAFYVAIVVFFSLRSEQFLTASNAINILSNVSVIGIVSIGQALTLISGGFDLSVSGTVPLGAVVFTKFINSGTPIVAAMIATILIGASVGVVNGVLITRVGINPLIATLGTMSITQGMAQTLTGGLTESFHNLDAGILAESSFGTVPNHIWVLLIVSVIAFLVLRFTVFGRSIYTIGGNREAARLAGLRVDLITISVYVICAALASLAGIIVASQLLAGSATLGTASALTSIAAVVLGGASLAGGKGGIGGTLIGVLILGTLANGLALLAVPAFYQQIATGVVLLLAVGLGRLRSFLGAEGD
jgi:ribose/xylose/arabinose/galactoside ABC-type transport system permease subunit